MKKIVFILSTLLASPVYADTDAEVFKCQLKSGRTVYQSLPCESAVKQEAIEIPKTDPHKVAVEEAKLKAWKEDFAKREEVRIKAEQELQAELDRKASVEALKKSAEYQQQQAREAKRQADAMEQQSRQPVYQQYQFYPYYPGYQQTPPDPSQVPNQHNAQDKTVTSTQQSGQIDLKIRKNSDSDSGHSKFLLNWK